MVQRLRSMLPMQGVPVQSLVGELRSHMPNDTAKNKIKINKTPSLKLLRPKPWNHSALDDHYLPSFHI